MAMNRDSNQPKSKTRKVVLIVVSLAALLMLGCGGLIYWVFQVFTRELLAARAAAEHFLDDLQAGRVAEAYAGTSGECQATQSQEQFESFVAKFPALREQTSRKITGLHLHQQSGQRIARVRVTVLGTNSSLSFTLFLVPEEDDWKVQRVSIP